jgi:hypothetical protein
VSEHAFIVIVEAHERLLFFQSFVVPAFTELTTVEQRIRKYLEARGARFVRIDPDDVTEVPIENIPPAWLAKASPEDGILACGGRTWVDPQLDEGGGLFARIKRWFGKRS